jgi:type II secretory pathway predicted ATPase ExeA
VYESYWELSRAPFRNVPDPMVFCPFATYQDALQRLVYTVETGQGSVLITGAAGCGKSTLSRVFLLSLDTEKYDVGLVINPALSPDEFLREVAHQLAVTLSSSERSSVFRSLRDHVLANAGDGRTTVLIVDDAHLIRDEAVFDDLSMLLNLQTNDRQLLSLVLIGLPSLRTTLEGLEPLRQRIALRLSLETPDEGETAQYVAFRLEQAGARKPIFTEDALRAIYKETGGVPRNVNKLCDICLYEGHRRKAREINAPLVMLAAALT